jgi:hypothetical protein
MRLLIEVVALLVIGAIVVSIAIVLGREHRHRTQIDISAPQFSKDGIRKSVIAVAGDSNKSTPGSG